jgi:hypothetical protein
MKCCGCGAGLAAGVAGEGQHARHTPGTAAGEEQQQQQGPTSACSAGPLRPYCRCRSSRGVSAVMWRPVAAEAAPSPPPACRFSR